ncbi:MAG: alpha/beta fold hydrolase [Deltaproteobacteria bacterium]|nr:alpha/beta fold hydrolase [Deltaproteobacteria bacterium]
MRRLSLVSLLLGLSAFLAACPSGEAPVGLILDAGEERADSGRDGDAPEPRDDAAEPWRDMVLPREDVPEIPRVDLPQEFLEQEMTWTPCVLHDRDGSGTAECADLVVPFYWDDLESETFTVHAKRLVREGSTRQLFMLQGGPGSPGTATLSLAMERVFDADPEMDVYAIDHRGTGKSHELTCPVQEAPDSLGGEEIIGDEWEACALHLETEALDAFTVSAAARDVALLIALAGEAGKAPLVYGVSYGTFWAHRYAVLFPEQPDAVVLDSLIPPGGYQVDIKDQEENEVTHVLFDLCAGDDLCASKLGEDPWGYANEVFQAYSAGQACDKLLAKGIYPETLQGFINGLGTMLWLGRAMIPAIFYRMDRCTGQDAVAVYNAIAWYYGLDGAYWREELSDALGRHLMLSELVFEPEGGAMTPDEILAYEAGLLSTRYLSYYNTIHLAF